MADAFGLRAHWEKGAASFSPFRQLMRANIIPIIGHGVRRRGIMEKVLVVDDNRTSRELIRAILKSVRCDIIEASHGQQALDVLRQERPDLVLLDIDMPG